MLTEYKLVKKMAGLRARTGHLISSWRNQQIRINSNIKVGCESNGVLTGQVRRFDKKGCVSCHANRGFFACSTSPSISSMRRRR